MVSIEACSLFAFEPMDKLQGVCLLFVFNSPRISKRLYGVARESAEVEPFANSRRKGSRSRGRGLPGVLLPVVVIEHDGSFRVRPR